MIKRLDLLLQPGSPHESATEYTLGLQAGLERCGVKTNLHVMGDKDPSVFLQSLMSDPPQATLSFNGLLPYPNGIFLCEMLNIPHIACLVHSPNYFMPLKESSMTLKAFTDHSHVEFFKSLGDPNSMFMTQGVDRELVNYPAHPKKYEIAMIASCIDIEAIETIWKENYSEKMDRTLHHAADICLRDPKVSYWQAFSEAMGIHHPTDLLELSVTIELLKSLESYIDGKDRLDLLRHLPELTIDVFGEEALEERSWSYYLKDCPNIRIHPPISFKEHYTIIQESKILLNSLAKIRQGGNERVFNTALLGSVSVASENLYLKEFYQDNESILFYHWRSWLKLQERIQHLLKDPVHYQSMVDKSREITLTNHTWDHRAKTLLANLKP